jgi:hypothetical protein
LSKANAFKDKVYDIETGGERLDIEPKSIDIGYLPCTSFGTNGLTYYTLITKFNPANAAGTSSVVHAYTGSTITTLYIGVVSFSGTNGTSRDYITWSNVTSGAERTLSDTTITIGSGDYIGCYYETGDISNKSSGGAGIYDASGNFLTDIGNAHAYTDDAGYDVSIGMEGTEAGGATGSSSSVVAQHQARMRRK